QRAGLERPVGRLVRHLLLAAARGEGEQGGEPASQGHRCTPPQLGTTITSTGASSRRNCSVARRSNLASRASMHRKKPSCVTRAKRGTLKTGWYGIGRPFRASM